MAGEMGELVKTPLGASILEDDLDKLKSLLQQGENPKLRDRKGNTYLHLIATTHSPKIIHCLVSTGIDVQAQNKHGNSALHVSALHNQVGHVCDLLMSGVDPTLRNKDGRRADEMRGVNKFWKTEAEPFEPGLFQAIAARDPDSVERLLRSWCRTDTQKDGRTARQFAAYLGQHDVVALIDRYKTPLDLVYALLEFDSDRLLSAMSKGACDPNFARAGRRPLLPLQVALRLGQSQHATWLCQPPQPEIPAADVNRPCHLLGGYLRGPLFFECPLRRSADWPDTLRMLLRCGADLRLRDSRCRTLPLLLLEHEDTTAALPLVVECVQRFAADLADRDARGLTLRALAELRREEAVVQLADQQVVRLLRTSDLRELLRLAVSGYRDFWFELQHRDSEAYAAGNESSHASDFLEWAAGFVRRSEDFHELVKTCDTATPLVDFIESVDNATIEILRQRQRQRLMQLDEQKEEPVLVLERREAFLLAKDDGGRCCLHLAILFDQEHAFNYLCQFQKTGADNETFMMEAERQPDYVDFLPITDNFGRTVLHYACASNNPVFRARLESKTATTASVKDVLWNYPQDYADRPEMLQEERSRSIGYRKHLRASRLHDKLLHILSNEGSVKEKTKALRNILQREKVHIERLEAKLNPPGVMVTAPRENLLAWVLRNRQWDFVRLLVHYGANPHRPLQLHGKRGEPLQLSAAEFAAHMGMTAIAEYISGRM